MDKQEVLQKLKSGNENLGGLTEAYFIYWANIDEPTLGNISFKYVKHHFLFALREYSITHSDVIEVYESPSCTKLLRLNGIPISLMRSYINSVDVILNSYTDEHLSDYLKIKVLYNQIQEYIDDNYDEKFMQKVHKALNDKKYGYHGEEDEAHLKNILKALRASELNQIDNNRYIAIDLLFKKYIELNIYREEMNFKEKKKYLTKIYKKSGSEAAQKKLVDYIYKIKDSSVDDDEAIEKVKLFFFHLVYGKNKIDIFLIHILQGYKYKGGVELYQRVFLKDYCTGKNDKFIHHFSLDTIGVNILTGDSLIYESVIHYMTHDF